MQAHSDDLSDMLTEKHYEKLNDDERYEVLHFLSHRIWDSVVNLSCLCKKAKLCLSAYPFYDLRKARVQERAIRSLSELRALLSREGCKSRELHQNTFIEFIDRLAETSHQIYNLVGRKSLSGESVTIQKFQADQYSNGKRLVFVKRFKDQIDKVDGVKIALLQGSLSTLDYTGFSDFDTFVILNGNLLDDTDSFVRTIGSLYRASVNFYLFDPLQHHRYFFAFEQDLQSYNQSFLPTEVWRYATILKGDSPIKTCSYNSTISHILFAGDGIEYLLKRGKANYNIRNYWQLKCFISMIFFLPVLWLESNASYVYKKESFGRIREFLPTDLSEYLDLCGQMRKLFKYQPSILDKAWSLLFLKFTRNPILHAYLMSKFSKNIRDEEYRVIFQKGLDYAHWFRDNLPLRRESINAAG